MSVKIFINYRRGASSGIAGRLHDGLVDAFGRRDVFLDVDTIPPGVDFERYLESQVKTCDVFLVIIGVDWLSANDDLGRRRLDQSDDFVAVEIAAALDRGIPVIPVLVDGAIMPNADALPERLKPLARRQAVELRNSQFGRDATALIDRIRTTSPLNRKISLMIAVVVTLLSIGIFVYFIPEVYHWYYAKQMPISRKDRVEDHFDDERAQVKEQIGIAFAAAGFGPIQHGGAVRLANRASGLLPSAVSTTGNLGLFQFSPSVPVTLNVERKRLLDPSLNIHLAIQAARTSSDFINATTEQGGADALDSALKSGAAPYRLNP